MDADLDRLEQPDQLQQQEEHEKNEEQDRQDVASDGTCSDSEDECDLRIGPEYQVDEIPLCVRELQNEGMEESEEAFAYGLPVPITTIRIKQQEVVKCASPEQEKDDEGLECEEGESSRNGGKRKGRKKRKANWMTFRRLRARTEQLEEVVVPGESFDAWEEIEEAGFLLGLYLFGKDFNALGRFLETRRLTDLQHYYYSIFYGSAPYKRWVAARHSCSRRIVNGHDILLGWRQEELLRRLLPEVEEHSRHELVEAIAEFSKGEVTFEKYVSRLKAAAGLELLIDSVGVGCGRGDLTVGSVEGLQNSKKQELLPGKAFSDYTGSEMFKALSGGYRLSKSRAQDLFWEGVWPRLLAKGWSSEQSGKSPLLYLLPGVKRYSKRSSVKGKHYFDSISEVLNHLAGDPSLLELPELDDELRAKSRVDAQKHTNRPQVQDENSNEVVSPSSERKRLWLSKGTLHARETEAEDGKEVRKKESQAEQGNDRREERIVNLFQLPGQLQVHLDFTGERKLEEGNSTALSLPANGSCEIIAREDGVSTSTSLARWQGGGSQLTRKRSYFETFQSSSSTSSVAGIGMVSAGQAWNERKAFVLNSMIKQYLGNGKSVRLYAPTKLVQSQESYKFFIKGFEQALYRNQKGIVSFNLSFLVTTAAVASKRRFLITDVEGGRSSVVPRQEQGTKQKEEAGSGVSTRIQLSCMECGATEEDGSVHKCSKRLQYL